jgi:predicted kinase
VLVQLSGVPGAGKSTLARGLAQRRGMVVLDTDVVKSSLIGSRIPVGEAGGPAYAAVLALATDLLAQGHEVVIDSPCRYPELVAEGQRVATHAGLPYALVELWAADPARLLGRLDDRVPRASQVASATEPVPGTGWESGTPEDTLRGWQEQLVRPDVGWLRVDAFAPPETTLSEVLAFLADR